MKSINHIELYFLYYQTMALFIDRNNQTLLWEMIHKNQQINNVFDNEQNKQEWFKQNISKQYDTIRTKSLSREDLSSINKNTLSQMWSELQTMNTEKTTRNNTYMNTMNLESTYSRNVPKQDSYNSEFENRQREYNSLFERPVPKEIDFSEKHDDEAITNMNELIERAKREREQEVVSYAPPPQTPKSFSLNIQEDLSDISENIIQPIVLESTIQTPKVSFIDQKKSFSIENLENLIFKMNQNIETLNEKMAKIEELLLDGSRNVAITSNENESNEINETVEKENKE